MIFSQTVFFPLPFFSTHALLRAMDKLGIEGFFFIFSSFFIFIFSDK